MKFCGFRSVFFLLVGFFHFVCANTNDNRDGLLGVVLDTKVAVPVNVYQTIYDAYVDGGKLDACQVGDIAGFFISEIGESATTKGKYEFQKRYFWMLITYGMSISFFNDKENCKYDEESIADRVKLRTEITYRSETPKKNLLFKSFLMLDSFQDLSYRDRFLSEIKLIIANNELDITFHQNLKNWLELIEGENEEQELKSLVNNTLFEAESKTLSVETSERLIPILRVLLSLGTGIAVYHIMSSQTTSHVTVISNSQNITLVNVTENDTRLQNISNIVIGPIAQINGTFIISNISAILLDQKVIQCTSPIKNSSVILAFFGVVGTFVLDFYLNVLHHVMYYFNILLFEINIESIPIRISNELYDLSKRISDKEEKKYLIKSIGNYLGDKIKKTWTQDGLVKDFRKNVERFLDIYAKKKEN